MLACSIVQDHNLGGFATWRLGSDYLHKPSSPQLITHTCAPQRSMALAVLSQGAPSRPYALLATSRSTYENCRKHIKLQGLCTLDDSAVPDCYPAAVLS